MVKTTTPSLNVRQITQRQIIIFLLLVGCALRLYYFASNRSLWSDEAALAVNIVTRPLSDLFKPLIYDQGSPTGFLLIEHLMVQLFGPGELALRLFPLIAGIGSIFAVYYVARRIMTGWAVAIAVGLFAVLETVIYYSSEVKQYSSDVLIALILIAVGLYFLQERRFGWIQYLLLAVTGAVCVWFSHPAIFVLAAVGIALALQRFARRDWLTLAKLVAVGAVWATSFAILYVTSLANLTQSAYLREFWSPGFMPFPPKSMNDIEWFIQAFYGALADKPMRLYASGGLAAFLLVIGYLCLYRKNRYQFLLLLLPIVFTLAASALKIYPFFERLILFLVPILTLMIAQGADMVWQNTASHAPVIGVVMLIMLFFNPTIYSFGRLLQRPPTITSVQEQRSVVDYLMKNRQPSDKIYVEFRAQYGVHYYAWFYHLEPGRDYQVGVDTRIDNADYKSDINQLCGNSRVWFLFSRFFGPDFDEWERRYTTYADSLGKKLDMYQDKGASAHLYDLSACNLNGH